MKRIGLSLIVVSIVGLFAFLCGCGKSNDQGSGTHPNETKLLGQVTSSDTHSPGAVTVPGETNRAGDTTENESGRAVDLALSGGLKPGDISGQAVVKSHDMLTLPDGTIYEGETVGGIPNGQGTSTDPRGTLQEGVWRNGQPYRVSGTWVGLDGTTEQGTWNLDGSKCGGTIKWPDGRAYKGDWKVVDEAAELPQGGGTMIWPDGRKYVGQFWDGQMEGQGTMTYPDGKVEDGIWKQGKFVGPVK